MMFVLFSSILMLLGGWQLVQTNNAVRLQRHLFLAIALNALSLTVSVANFGLMQGLIVYTVLLFIAGTVYYVFNQYMVDETSLNQG